jgi:hypothetical protein
MYRLNRNADLELRSVAMMECKYISIYRLRYATARDLPNSTAIPLYVHDLS